MIQSLINNILGNFDYNKILSQFHINGDKNIINDTIAILFEGLAKNTKSTQGIQSLLAALDRDHDGSILDDLNNILQNNNQGEKIVQHIFQGKSNSIIKILANKNNISESQSKELLSNLAPIVMGAIGRERNTKNLDAAEVRSMLQETDTSFGSNILTNSVIKLLDQDGDGDIDLMDALKFFT